MSSAEGSSGEARLAAIMFTDIASYSRLMEQDEDRTIALLKEHNRILFPLIESFQGRLVDAIGDGLLVLFPSVRDATTCALEIQYAIQEYNRTTDPHMQFRLRIGIHLGEIREDEGRVFGAGVNEAARILPFSRPGGICLSEDVYRQVRAKVHKPYTPLGKKELRNISRPIELFALETGAEHESSPSAAGGSSGTPGQNDTESQERNAAPGQSPAENGEVDEAKARLVRERDKLAEKRKKGEEEFSSAIERSVYGIAERVLDTAIAKWDSLPEETKHKAIAEVSSEVSKKKGKEKEKKDNKDAGGGLIAGTVFGTGFGIGFFGFGLTWMIVPFILLGILPFATGLRALISRDIQRKKREEERPKIVEQAVLEAASDLGGRVTVIQVANKAKLPLDEVQDALDRMTARGYVGQEVTETGIIRYDFGNEE